jgi:hypothetical protein
MGKYVCEIEGITTAAYLDVEGKYTVYGILKNGIERKHICFL